MPAEDTWHDADEGIAIPGAGTVRTAVAGATRTAAVIRWRSFRGHGADVDRIAAGAMGG